MRPLLLLLLLLLLVQRSMRLWPRGLWPRRRLASRQPAQDLVEFGLIVAAVSILGIAGLNVLGRAEEGYFIPLASTLAPRAPVGTDDVVHPTTVKIDCSPATVVATMATNLSCLFTVTDAWTAKRTAPGGSVHLLYGATDLGSCSLVPDAGGQAFSTCRGIFAWTAGTADVGARQLAAHYVPTDGTHSAPTIDPSQTIDVVQVTAAFTAPPGQTTPCWNPLSIFPRSPEQVEVGHPLICHVTVKDSVGHVYASTPVTVSEAANPSGGQPFFSCFTNNDLSAYVRWCNPAGSSFSGTTDQNGELMFVYRRYYDSLGSTVADSLTATATDYSGSSQTRVAIAPAKQPHTTETIVRCSHAYVPSGAQATLTSPSLTSPSGLVAKSDVQLVGPAGVSTVTVTCTIAVYDADLDYTGNPDNEAGYSPSGVVTLKDDMGMVFGTCTLSPGNAIGTDYLPLQQPSAVPGTIALPDYAATCLPLSFSITGDHHITANYVGNTPQHKSSVSPEIDADFH